MATPRVFNFAAGPAVLPLPVLEEAQRDLVSMPGVGMSILQMSHRGKFFEGVLQQTEKDIRALAGVPDDYKVLFLPGGASLQFSMVPLNFLPRDGSADYIVSGAWSQKAVKEAKKVGGVKIAWTGEADNFKTIPTQGDLTLDPNPAYVSFTSNETIHGVEFKYVPDTGNVPLVCDTSSDMFSRPIDVKKPLRRSARSSSASSSSAPSTISSPTRTRDFFIHLGDCNGIGSPYKWKNWGLPYKT